MTAVALPAPTPITDLGVLGTDTVPSAAGNTFQNNGKQFLKVKNSSGSLDLILTVDAFPTGCQAAVPDGLTVTDRAVTIAKGTEKMIGPFPPSIYNNASGAVSFTTDSQTDMLVSVLELTSNPN